VAGSEHGVFLRYFRSEADSLGARSGAKARSHPQQAPAPAGERFLDIGCGWARCSASSQEVRRPGDGRHAQPNQYEFASQRIREEGLEGRCEVRLQDYRDIPGEGVLRQDRRVGMFEHVGLRHLKVYFEKIGRCWPRAGSS